MKSDEIDLIFIFEKICPKANLAIFQSIIGFSNLTNNRCKIRFLRTHGERLCILFAKNAAVPGIILKKCPNNKSSFAILAKEVLPDLRMNNSYNSQYFL